MFVYLTPTVVPFTEERTRNCPRNSEHDLPHDGFPLTPPDLFMMLGGADSELLVVHTLYLNPHFLSCPVLSPSEMVGFLLGLWGFGADKMYGSSFSGARES